MLSPKELQEIADTMYPLLDDLNAWITKDVIRRMMARMDRGEDPGFSASDKWQLRLYQDAAGHYDALQQEIKKWTQFSDQEVQAIFEDAAIRAWAAEDAFYIAQGYESVKLLKSESLMNILADTYQRTNGTIHNFTRTIAKASEQRFINACDKAHLKVITGAQSYTGAVAEAVEELAGSQLTVSYPSGHIDTIETAVLRCVRTGTAQASGNMTLQGMLDHDWDVILVSAHLGARYGDGGENPGNHFWWQGKHYTYSGRTPGLPRFTVTGYGTGEGLCGWNCRHSFGPGIVGHNPYEAFDAEENKRAYDLSQRQRRMERGIRHTKTKLIGYQEAINNCEDEETKEELQRVYDSTALKLKRQNEAYNKFCKDNDLRRLDDRLATAKWDREQAKKSIVGARNAEEDAQKASADRSAVAKLPGGSEVQQEPPVSISSALQRQEVTQEYVDNAKPNDGSILFEDGYDKANNKNEIATAEWVHQNLGGDIKLLKVINEDNKKTPDYLWRSTLWDQKGTTTEAAANTAIQRGLKQIKENPGGVFLDYNIGRCDIVWEDLLAVMDKRMQWYHGDAPIDVIVILNGGTFRAVRYFKK